MQLAWLQLAAGLVHSSLLTEYRHGAAGHVVWSGMAATAILFIVSVLVLVERSRSRASSSLRSGWPHPRTAVCYAALVLHVIAPWTLHLNPGVR